MIAVKRAYEAASAEDGIRILVDRLWPRGVTKAQARIDRWAKELAPSTDLRQWFGHDPAKWSEFQRRYRTELEPRREDLKQIAGSAERSRVTLVYGAKDEYHNGALVLKELISSLSG